MILVRRYGQLWLGLRQAVSFYRAARKLEIKQATLSSLILKVEQRLGMVIFERTTLGAVPTSDGASYLLGAKRLVDEFDRLNHRR